MSFILDRDLLFLVLQFLKEKGLKNTAHLFEQESGIFFDMMFFENMVLKGEWDNAERYLSGFTRINDNGSSIKIYFNLRKHKFLEALDNKEVDKALNILTRELKVFKALNEEMYKELNMLFAEENIRDNVKLSTYGDTYSARKRMMYELKKTIQENPIIQGKLRFPDIKDKRLMMLINQSLNWQHQLCVNPDHYPQVATLFEDHKCPLPPILQLEDNSESPQVHGNLIASSSGALSDGTDPVAEVHGNLIALSSRAASDGGDPVPGIHGNLIVSSSGAANDGSDPVMQTDVHGNLIELSYGAVSDGCNPLVQPEAYINLIASSFGSASDGSDPMAEVHGNLIALSFGAASDGGDPVLEVHGNLLASSSRAASDGNDLVRQPVVHGNLIASSFGASSDDNDSMNGEPNN